MKLAIIYSDKRGKYVSQGCSTFCDVVEYDLSSIMPRWWQKPLSAIISYHWDRKHWQNDFYRNPLAIYFRKVSGESFIKENIVKVDAVLQFGVMTYYDYQILGNPNIYYYHDGAYDWNNPYWLSPRYGKRFCNNQRKWLIKACRIFTFSEWARKQHIYERSISQEKVFNVGWGPCIPLKNEFVKQKNIAKKFIFIGGEPWRKGLDILLQAFKQLTQKYNNISLDVIGTKDNEFTKYSTSNVIFHGYCDANKIINILSSNDIFVLPSRYERAGHATIEAMWYGLPVIVTNTCGLPEPVNNSGCGYVIKSESVQELENAMISLIETPQLVMEMSKKAIISSRDSWTWDKTCERIIREIQNSLCDTK